MGKTDANKCMKYVKINGSHYQPVVPGSYLDARICYVLESKKNGKLFDVAMWGGYDWLSYSQKIYKNFKKHLPSVKNCIILNFAVTLRL